MRSMLKKTLALVLCLVMCLSLFPTAASADAEIAEEAAEPAVLSESEGTQGTRRRRDGAEDHRYAEGDRLHAPEARQRRLR